MRQYPRINVKTDLENFVGPSLDKSSREIILPSFYLTADAESAQELASENS